MEDVVERRYSFDVAQHIVDVSKFKDGSALYLLIAARKAMFREDYPLDGDKVGIVKVFPLELAGRLFIKAEVEIDGAVHAEDYSEVSAGVQSKVRAFEKAVTAAIGRALGNAGYGTLEAGDDYLDDDPTDDQSHPADAPVVRPRSDVLPELSEIDELIAAHPDVTDWDALANWMIAEGMAKDSNQAYTMLARFHRADLLPAGMNGDDIEGLLSERWENRS